MNNDAYQGTQTPESSTGNFNLTKFIVEQLINRVNVSALVQIVDVYTAGDLEPVGVVDVLPLVSQVDGQGNPVAHTTVFSIPYFRVQGGSDAVIIDPKVGDIGLAVFADRDISKVKATQAIALPGSNRRFDIADGLYFGGFLNGTPTQYIRFTAGGVFAVSPTKITVQAPVSEIDSSTSCTVKAPIINLSDGVATLRKFIMDNFITFFNNHVHTVGGGTPTVPMDGTYATNNVKGA